MLSSVLPWSYFPLIPLPFSNRLFPPPDSLLSSHTVSSALKLFYVNMYVYLLFMHAYIYIYMNTCDFMYWYLKSYSLSSKWHSILLILFPFLVCFPFSLTSSVGSHHNSLCLFIHQVLIQAVTPTLMLLRQVS